MKLRDHPRMSRNRASNWPPVWTSLFSEGDQLPLGEIGVLKEVRPSQSTLNRFILIMEYNQNQYSASLTFDDVTLCKQVFEWMKAHVGWKIKHIGNAELGLAP